MGARNERWGEVFLVDYRKNSRMPTTVLICSPVTQGTSQFDALNQVRRFQASGQVW